jgi:hypothetical protein
MVEINRRNVRLQPRTRFRISVVILALAALPLSASSLLLSNFGPPGMTTYQTGGSDAWLVGNGGTGEAVGGFQNTGSFGVSLAQIDVADTFFSGASSPAYDNLTVGIWQNSTDNLTGATELESWTVLASSLSMGGPPSIITLNSTTTPTINTSDFYFITETVPVDPTPNATQAIWGWQWNNQGQTGYLTESSPSGPWAAGTVSPESTPAFEVFVSAPEPRTTAALLAVGLLGMLILRRRRNVQA